MHIDTEINERCARVSASKTFNTIVNAFDLGKKSVLDIGCSYGEFLMHFGAHSVGISISKDEVAYGNEKGLDIRYGNIESDSFVLEEKFDVIFANNIFEHLQSPHAFLLNIKKYMNSEGILILGVPCIPKIVSLLHAKKFRGSLADAHINFFTRDTLMKTVESAGYKIIEARGFRFANTIIDHSLDPIYPHFYVVASPLPNFTYSEKKKREMAGYASCS